MNRNEVFCFRRCSPSSFRLHPSSLASMSLSRDIYVPQVAVIGADYSAAPVEARAWRGTLLAWSLTLAATLVLLLGILAAPLAASMEHPLLALTFRRAFAFACHQIPERSFHLGGVPLAVCARCWGVYCGFAAGVAFYPLASRIVTGSFVTTIVPARRWLLFAVLPTSVDFLLGFAGLWENTHWSRALTGALAGAGAACFVIPGVFDAVRVRSFPNADAEASKSCPT